MKIDKIQKPLKSIAEIGHSDPLCIWIVCTTPELVCGGGEQGIGTPCILGIVFFFQFLITTVCFHKSM